MNLIINADDFGFSRSTNEAILELASLGSLSSTTVMVNMPYWREVSKLLAFENFGIGLHFNLTQGVPISDPSKIQSLINPQTYEFYSYRDFMVRSKKGLFSKAEILTELEAQFDLLKSVIGERFTHFDSHQAIHKYSPVSDVLIVFGQKYKLKYGLRTPHHYFIKADSISEVSLSTLFKFGLKRVLVDIFYMYYNFKLKNYYRLPNGYLLHHTLKKTATLLALNDLSVVKDFIVEISCHPATRTDDLPLTKLVDKRIEEYQILKSDAFIESLRKFKLINFKQINY